MKKIEERREELKDDEQHDKYLKDMFYNEERTEHKGILPARERIKQYKTKVIRRQQGLPPRSSLQQKYRMIGVSSTADIKQQSTAKAADRPTTAGIASTFGISDNQTAVSVNQATSVTGSQLASNIRALSASSFPRFEEQEKAVQKPKFKCFFTSNEPTTYHRENRFEGRSNYQYYYPTGETFE